MGFDRSPPNAANAQVRAVTAAASLELKQPWKQRLRTDVVISWNDRTFRFSVVIRGSGAIRRGAFVQVKGLHGPIRTGPH